MDREIPFSFSAGSTVFFNDQRIESDLIFIKQHFYLKISHQWENHLHAKTITEAFLKTVKNISYDPHHCFAGQVSCVFTEYPKTIFLTPSYFLMNQLDRVMSLIHEMYHLRLGGAHVPCREKKLAGQDCDEFNMSAYGLELYLYIELKEKLGKKDQNSFFNLEKERLYQSRINQNLLKHL